MEFCISRGLVLSGDILLIVTSFGTCHVLTGGDRFTPVTRPEAAMLLIKSKRAFHPEKFLGCHGQVPIKFRRLTDFVCEACQKDFWDFCNEVESQELNW